VIQQHASWVSTLWCPSQLYMLLGVHSLVSLSVVHAFTLPYPHELLDNTEGCMNSMEAGLGTYPVYNAETNLDNKTYIAAEYCNLCSNDHEGCTPSGAPNGTGTLYAPHESVLSIQNSGDYWFWHAGAPYLSAQQLWWHYLQTVGRAWCAFSDTNLHSRMPLSFTPAFRLKRSYACEQ
jgi:hypothetical protein